MNHVESDNFFVKHVNGRFSKWEPEPAEISDWLYYIKGMEEDVALKAIREHKAKSRFNTPTLATFLTLASGLRAPKEKVDLPVDTVFIFYAGGGRGTLLPGYFCPAIVLPKEQQLIMKAAENLRKYYEDNYGGEWKVYSQTTSSEMVKMRRDIRAAITDNRITRQG